MSSIMNRLREKDISFSFMYYGINDYSTFYEIKTILEDKEFFQNCLSEYLMDSIKTLGDYYDYLILKKISLLKEAIPQIKTDEDKEIIESISMSAFNCIRSIGKGDLIEYINKNYAEIFNEDTHEFLLPQITLDLIVPFQKGIAKEVFQYLTEHYNYLLLNEYSNFQKLFEKEPDVFAKLFHYKNLKEIEQLGLDRVFDIFITILNGSNEQLKGVVSLIIENVIKDAEELVETTTFDNSREILANSHILQQVYNFLKKIKHIKANEFSYYNKQVQKKLHDYLKSHGQKFTYDIPAGKIIEELKKCPTWKDKMLSLTHSLDRTDPMLNYVSCLASPSKGKQGISDFVSSNIPSDDYFTYSHQTNLQVIVSVASATIVTMWHDEELFPECLRWYISFLSFISDKINCNENLVDDIQTLHLMLQPVILSDDKDNEALKPLCYGAGMFICAMTEKLLRSFYIYLLKDKMYVPLTSATLGTLLSYNNGEMSDIFGKDHLKNLAYFLNVVGDKKIGYDIRNSLAHWVNMDKTNLNSMLVAELFYLYTDVVNTLFLYLNTHNQDDKK